MLFVTTIDTKNCNGQEKITELYNKSYYNKNVYKCNDPDFLYQHELSFMSNAQTKVNGQPWT